MEYFSLWLESEKDFPLAHWRQAIDYFQDEPDEKRLNWLGHWLYENTYNFFQKLGDKYFEIEGEEGQFPDENTPQMRLMNAMFIVGEHLAGMEWAAIKDAVSGGGPNLQRYLTYLRAVFDNITKQPQYAPLSEDLNEWVKYIKEFWDHFKTVKTADPPAGGNKPIFKNSLWTPEDY